MEQAGDSQMFAFNILNNFKGSKSSFISSKTNFMKVFAQAFYDSKIVCSRITTVLNFKYWSLRQGWDRTLVI